MRRVLCGVAKRCPWQDFPETKTEVAALTERLSGRRCRIEA